MEENTPTNECQELKNIKYKTMLLNGVPLQETKSSNVFIINSFLKNSFGILKGSSDSIFSIFSYNFDDFK